MVDWSQLSGAAPAVPLTLSLDGDPLVCEQWLRQVKGNRLVARATWRGETFVAKLFVGGGVRSRRRLNRAAEGSRALAELAQAPPVREVREEEGGGVLLVEWLDDAAVLADRFRELADDPLERAELIAGVGEQLAAMHEGGLVHVDLHLGNFVAAAGQTWCVDGDAVRRWSERPLSREQSLGNLADLLAQLPPHADALRTRACASYARRRGWESVDDDVAPRVAAIRRRLTARYLKKVSRPSRRTAEQTCWRRRSLWSRIDAPEALAQLVATIEERVVGALERDEPHRMLKRGDSATVLVLDGIVVKRSLFKTPFSRLRRSVRTTRAEWGWRIGHLLARAEVQDHTPLALVERRWGPLRGQTYLLTRLLEGLRGDKLPELEGAERERAMKQLAEWLHRMRAAGVSHGDLKASNLWYVDGSWIGVDLDAARWHSRLTSRVDRRIARDIRRLLRNWEHLPELRDRLAEHLRGRRLPVE